MTQLTVSDSLDLYDGKATSALLESGSSGGSSLTSAVVSIQVDGGGTEVDASVHTLNEDGLASSATAEASTKGEETTTSIDLVLQSSDQEVFSNSAVTTEVQGEGEATAKVSTVSTDGDALLIFSEGEAAAAGEDPSASIGIVSTANDQGSGAVLTGDVQAEASVLAEEDADASANAEVATGPDFDVTSEAGGTSETISDGFLIVYSSSSVEAVEIELLDFEAPQSGLDSFSFAEVW